MTVPVDLTNLRTMTDGDMEMEKELFKEFYTSFETGMGTLQAHCDGESSEAWRKEAHALKGIALNLGADKLGALCKTGQDDYQAATAAKKEMLQNIQVEYALVKQFMQKLYPH